MSTEELSLPKDVIDEYMRLRRESIVRAKEYYFREIMPRLAQWLDAQGECRKLADLKFDCLVSLMGFSPETTVQAAAILRPKKIRVAFSRDAEELYNLACDYLHEHSGYRASDIRYEEVNPYDSNSIWQGLNRLLPASGTPALDITGGTKLMSATAGALAWERGMPLCYLRGVWDPENGSAGLEAASRLVFYHNPSRLRGYQVRAAGLDHYRKGNFRAAAEAFGKSKALVPDYAFEDLAVALCECYAAMSDLHLDHLRGAVDRLAEEVLPISQVRALFEGRTDMDGHVKALRRLAEGDRDAITAAFVELAVVYAEQSRHDFACMLCYRAMEALVEVRLKQLFPALDLRDPDWSLVMPVEELRAQMEKIERRPVHFPPFIGLEAGFKLLCLADGIHLRFPDKREMAAQAHLERAIGAILGFAARRNQSILAHGAKTLGKADSEAMLDGVRRLASAVYQDGIDGFQQLLEDLRRRPLAEFAEVRG